MFRHAQLSEGCEFDPRGGLLLNHFIVLFQNRYQEKMLQTWYIPILYMLPVLFTVANSHPFLSQYVTWGFPANVLYPKRENRREFVEWCGYIPSFNVGVRDGLSSNSPFLRVLAWAKKFVEKHDQNVFILFLFLFFSMLRPCPRKSQKQLESTWCQGLLLSTYSLHKSLLNLNTNPIFVSRMVSGLVLMLINFGTSKKTKFRSKYSVVRQFSIFLKHDLLLFQLTWGQGSRA